MTTHCPRNYRTTSALRGALWLIALCSLLCAQACASLHRTAESPTYWESLEDEQLAPEESTARWQELHTAHREPINAPDWVSAIADGEQVKLAFEARCVHLVKIPREQLQDFQNYGGWKSDLALYSLATAVPAFVTGGIALYNSGDGWDDSLASGHPSIPSYNSQQDLEAIGIAGLAIGGGLTALAATAFGFNYLVTTDVMDTETWYGLRRQPCDSSSDNLVSLAPRGRKVRLNDFTELQVDAKGRLKATQAGGVPPKWIEALFQKTTTLLVDVDVSADISKPPSPLASTQLIYLNPGASDPVLNRLARLLGREGLHVNQVDTARLQPIEGQFKVTLDARGTVGPIAGISTAALKERLGDTIQIVDGRVAARKLVAPPSVSVDQGTNAPVPLTSKPLEGLVRFTGNFPLTDITFTKALVNWTGEQSAPELTASLHDLTWRIADEDRVGAQIAQLNALSAKVSKLSFEAVNLSSGDYDTSARMSAAAPAAKLWLERGCVRKGSALEKPCKALSDAWRAREKKFIASIGKDLLVAAKKAMKETNAYYAAQKRSFDKREGTEISEDADPTEAAENDCSTLENIRELVCDKGSPLRASTTCSIVKGCPGSVRAKVKSLASKVKARRVAQERAEACAERKCPGIMECSQSVETDYYGRIRAYQRSCSYMIEPCMHVRGMMAAMKCMEKRYNSCTRSCGVRD